MRFALDHTHDWAHGSLILNQLKKKSEEKQMHSKWFLLLLQCPSDRHSIYFETMLTIVYFIIHIIINGGADLGCSELRMNNAKNWIKNKRKMWNSDLFTNYRIEIYLAYHYNDTSVLKHFIYKIVNLKLSTIPLFCAHTESENGFSCLMFNEKCKLHAISWNIHRSRNVSKFKV